MTIGVGWLAQFLDQVIERQLCTKIGCTTCGAQEFRHELIAGLGILRAEPRRLNADRSLQLLEAASDLEPPRADVSKRIEAIRLILFDCSAALGGDAALPQMKALLGHSWAGRILDAMIAHHGERIRARREHEDRSDPDKVLVRRQQLKDESQQRHQERLEKKQLRDAARRSSDTAE